MGIEQICIGENIEVMVVKAVPEFGILPYILLFSLAFFIFLGYKALKTKNGGMKINEQ